MAKAALEAMNGLNLFGEQGSLVSTIHVDPDAQYRNCVILNNLLPKESSSKETDASLLCITGYPAFAIDDPALRKKTEARVKELLEVQYVCTCNIVKMVTMLEVECLTRGHVPLSPTRGGWKLVISDARDRTINAM